MLTFRNMKSNFWEQNVFNIIEGSILEGNNMSNVSGLNSVKQYPVPVVSFKANNPPVGMPMDRQQYDSFVRSQQQKQDRKDKWQKAGTLASIGLAAAFITIAITSIASHRFNVKQFNKIEAEKAAQKAAKNSGDISQAERDLGVKSKEEMRALFKNVDKEKSIEELKLSQDQQKLVDEIVDNIKDAKTYEEFCHKINQAFLLYGPPGTGKTTIVFAICKKLGVKPFIFDMGAMKGGYQGVLEKNMNKAKEVILEESKKHPDQPTIVIFDECDEVFQKSIDPHDNVILTRFKRDLDEFRSQKGLYIFGMTNKAPTELNEAIESRFVKKLIKAQTGEQLEDICFNHFAKGGDKIDQSLKEKSDKSREFFDIVKAREGRHFACRELELVGWTGIIENKNKPYGLDDIIRRTIAQKDSLRLSEEEVRRLEKLLEA